MSTVEKTTENYSIVKSLAELTPGQAYRVFYRGEHLCFTMPKSIQNVGDSVKVETITYSQERKDHTRQELTIEELDVHLGMVERLPKESKLIPRLNSTKI
jgi:hypothetical protein